MTFLRYVWPKNAAKILKISLLVLPIWRLENRKMTKNFMLSVIGFSRSLTNRISTTISMFPAAA